MRYIYENATTVHIWLSTSMDEHPHVLQRLANLNKQSTTDDLGNHVSFWRPLDAINNDKYWSRVWIQQEVAFARKLLIHCRKSVFPGECLHCFQNLIEDKVAAFVDLGWIVLSLIFADLSGVHRASRGDEETTRGRRASRPYSNLIKALCSCEHLVATDPRDKVYALLSLVGSDLVSEFGVDYAMPVVEVYLKVARFALEKDHSIGFLAREMRSSGKYDIPSWVPDWSAVASERVFAEEYVMRPENGQGLRYCPRISEDGLRLTVFGKHLDTVSRIDSTMSWLCKADNWESIAQIWFDQLRLIDEILSGDDGIRPASLDDICEAAWETFFRTMIRADNPAGRIGIREYLPQFKTLLEDVLERQWRVLSALGAVSEIARFLWCSFVEICWMKTHWRYLCITNSRTMGLVPDNIAQCGDQIWALLHCSTPILLRPIDDHYEVIGPCYIDDEHIHEDLMGGLADDQKYPISEIVLR